MLDYELAYWFKKPYKTLNSSGEEITSEKTFVVTLEANDWRIQVNSYLLGTEKSTRQFFRTYEFEKALNHFSKIVQGYIDLQNDGWRLYKVRIETC